MYAYVGAHSNLVDNAFYHFEPLFQLAQRKARSLGTLEVCSLGGGPGPELLGFVKFFNRMLNDKDRIDIRFSLIDKIPEWDESWQALVDGLEKTFVDQWGTSRRNWPIAVHRSFLSLDLLSLKEFGNFVTRFSQVEIFILNHTVSELMATFDAFQEVFHLLVQRASDNTYFLFIDRNQAAVFDAVRMLLQHQDLEMSGDPVFEQSNMDSDEQKTDLGIWYKRMGRDPKLTWNVFYTLARKWTFPF